MKKILLVLLCSSIQAAQEVPVFKIVSDCNQEDEDNRPEITFIFSDWNELPERNATIARDNIHLSALTRQKMMYLSNIAVPALDLNQPRLIFRGRGHFGSATLPLTSNNFPFRIVITKVNHRYAHSFLFSNNPKTPGATYMSVEEANSPDTIVHFSCNKNNPYEIADWRFTVESPKREIHKAAMKPISEEEAKVLKTAVTPAEEKALREQAQRAGTEFVKVPKERGIPEIVAGYLEELNPEERAQVQKELEEEARAKP